MELPGLGLNSLNPGKSGSNVSCVIFKKILDIHVFTICYEIVLMVMPLEIGLCAVQLQAITWTTWTNTDKVLWCFNTLNPRQNGRHFLDNIFKCIFINEGILILTKISLKFVPKGPINNLPALVQIMAWCQPEDEPLSEPMMAHLLMHMFITQPQCVVTSSQTNELNHPAQCQANGELVHWHICIS